MYAKFYGFDRLAFQLTPDPEFFYESAEHRRAMAHMTYGLHHAEGFIVITGDVGAGKTMLVDRLLSQIDASSYLTARIVTSQLSGDDLLRMVAAGFGLDDGGMAKGALLARIQEFVHMQSAPADGPCSSSTRRKTSTFEALEELRMLSNIAVGTADRVAELSARSAAIPRRCSGNSALDQLRQRITAAYHLGPLNEADTRGYVEHRLLCAGWKGDPRFSDDCFAPIYRHTGGVPRRINTLCSRLLLCGFLDGATRSPAPTSNRSQANSRPSCPPSRPRARQ